MENGVYARSFTRAAELLGGVDKLAARLGRVNEEQIDFVEKLMLVEREAMKLAADLPSGVMRGRAEHIAMVVRLLKARLDVLPAVMLPSTKKTEQL